jgi:hypothetical protein
VRWYSAEFADAYLLKRPASPGYSRWSSGAGMCPIRHCSPMRRSPATSRRSAPPGAAIHRVHAPAQINYLCMNNRTAHVHTHVLPRHLDDSGPRTMLPDQAFAAARPLAAAELLAQLGRLNAAPQ